MRAIRPNIVQADEKSWSRPGVVMAIVVALVLVVAKFLETHAQNDRSYCKTGESQLELGI